MNTAKTLELLRSEAADIRMRELYGADKAEENIHRYEDLVQKFQENFGEKVSLMILTLLDSFFAAIPTQSRLMLPASTLPWLWSV